MSRPSARTLIMGALSISLLGLAVWLATPAAVWDALALLSPAAVLTAASLIAVSYLLSWGRYRATLRAFGVDQPVGGTFRSFALGQLAAQFLFNVVGQSVVRAATLRPVGGGSGAVVTLTFVERLVAMAVLGAAGLAGALLLFGGIEASAGGLAYPALVLGTALAAVTGTLVLLLPRLTGPGSGAAIAAVLRRVLPTVPLTIVMHACMLGAWLVLIGPFRTDQSVESLVAGALVVMFIASVPISFAGWGLREFSAAAVFGHLAMAPQAGVAAGVVLGTLSLAAVLIGAAIATAGGEPRSTPAAAAPADGAVIADLRVAVVTLGCLCVVLVWYTLRLPIPGGGAVAVTLSDPFALAALGLAALALWRDRRALVLPRAVLWPLIGMAGIIALSLAIGLMRFGPSSWALVNRGLGGLVLVGYLAVGPLLVAAGGEAWRRLAFTGLIANGVLAGLVALGVLLGVLAGFHVGGIAFTSQVEGFSANRNAFAFQLMIALAAALPLLLAPERLRLPWVLAGAVLVLMTLLTASRLAWPGLAMLATLAILAGGRVAAGRILCIILVAMLPWLLLQATPLLAQFGFSASAGWGIAGLPSMAVDQSRTFSNEERLTSLLGAWELFRAHPWFGAGLGAFMQQRLSEGLPALVIHSVPAWLLAETGILGLVAFAALLAGLLRVALTQRHQESGWRGVVVLGAVAVFLLFGLVHDIFYQRSFWLVLGLAVALVPRRAAPIS